MFGQIKRLFFFPVASYFRFFAQIQLSLWKPRVIVITGSSGKTTLLHLIESQLGDHARYSHQANSSFGIPFDILGFKRSNLVLSEWIYLFLAAPYRAFKKPYQQKIYIIEADCDRPGEGEFLANLLKPEVTMWLSCSRTHSINFEQLVEEDRFKTVEAAIAYEFGHFLAQTSDLVLVNGDNKLITDQLKRSSAVVQQIEKSKILGKYQVLKDQTEFLIDNKDYQVPALVPEETCYSIAMTVSLLDYLEIEFDNSFKDFSLPPGRSSLFKGLKHTSLIDSSYNATLDGMTTIIKMFDLYPAKFKWAVIGDILEQGSKEQEEHQKLAQVIAQTDLSHIILMGPRVSQYTAPALKTLIKGSKQIEVFTTPKEALAFLENHIHASEVILFKGARFLEGVIEHLLLDKGDSAKLCRREKVWQARREQWGL